MIGRTSIGFLEGIEKYCLLVCDLGAASVLKQGNIMSGKNLKQKGRVGLLRY